MKRAKTTNIFLLTIFLIPILQLTVFGQIRRGTSVPKWASTRTSTVIAVQKAGSAFRFDKFKALKSEDEKTRLDYFSNELQRDSTRKGYIVVFGKIGGPTSEAKKRAQNAKNYLLTKLPSWHVLETIDYCTRPEVEYELWIVPKDKNPPFFCSKPR